jgi:hypothetical protein
MTPKSARLPPLGSVPPVWGSLNFANRSNLIGAGGELGMPGGPDLAVAEAEFDGPPCRIYSWQGNVSVYCPKAAEYLFWLAWDEADGQRVFLPLIVKCWSTAPDGTMIGTPAKEIAVQFNNLDLPNPSGKMYLHLESLQNAEANFEMQTVVKMIPI